MKISTTWQKLALEPTFVMPNHAVASGDAGTPTCGTTAVVLGAPIAPMAPMAAVRIDAARVKGSFPGSPAWSPPIS